MLRDFMINGAKAPDAMHKAKIAMKTGMAVIEEDSATDKFANVTSTESVSDIYFVDKERIPTGINSARSDMSDYDDNFVDIAANEFVTMNKYAPGEKFGTDQFAQSDFTAETAIDTRVAFKNGEAIKSTIASPYQFKGLYKDNGHTLIQIKLSDTTMTNAVTGA